MGVQRQYAIIEAPSILGLKPTGVERLAASFVGNGLVAGVKARHAGRVEPPGYSAVRDPETLTLNAHGIAEWSPQLADAVENVLDRDECPLILGGDWSILLVSLLKISLAFELLKLQISPGSLLRRWPPLY